MKFTSSLTNRIFLASAVLTVLCISTAVYLVNARVTGAAEDELYRGLEKTGAVVDEQRATFSELFAVLARTVADLPKLKAAVATNDPPTVQPIAADYCRRVHADLFLVHDHAGRLLAALLPAGVRGEAVSGLPSIRAAESGREAGTFLPVAGALLEVISVPITAGPDPPQYIGALTVGFLLDDALAGRFKKLTGSDIAFAAGGRLVASTLGGSAPALGSIAGMTGITPVSAGGEDYLALVRPLRVALGSALPESRPEAVNGTESSAADRPTVIILRSRTERLRLLKPIHAALIATGVVAVLLAVALSYAIARTITRPLAAITDVMKEISATGDLTRKIDWRPGRWDDEDAGLLARTFNTLTGSITRFQAEAAERERLSALGRLSTVIAHEVRNPLMIIKASLRPLTRAGAATDVREAAGDIDEEVNRLNRLVDDVLDFARPLRFDLAPVDLAALCQAAVAAAGAGHDVPVRLTVDRSMGAVTTDAERLRSALVNLVVNACQAVEARGPRSVAAAASSRLGTPAAELEPDVEVIAGPSGNDRVEIVVRDRGVGIEPSDLARVFDPYFTTKRSGSGLGLAIARNIVQGLGGSIGIRSQPGAGTEIRVELPASGPQEQQR